MKPHIIFKQGQYWVFSSKKASLDCMPWYKVDADSEEEAFKAVSEIKKKVEKRKANIIRLDEKRLAYKAEFEQIKQGTQVRNVSVNGLYLWAANLNK